MKAKNKIGIGCDNYKLSKFKELLDEKGYTYTVTPFTTDTTFIQINAMPDKQSEIHGICLFLEAYFNRSN